jgi:hypothetical protein
MSKYFASLPKEEAAPIIMGKILAWQNSLDANGYIDKVKRSWAKYHGASYENLNDGHQIKFQGEQGELVSIKINHFRNIAQNMLVLTTTNRPALDARSVNTDYKSLVQTRLSNGLLDYYMREKRMENYIRTAVEYAIALGSGYVKMEWNSSSGKIYDFNEETNTPIYEGDVVFANLSCFDVVFDPTKEHTDHDWITTRSFKNKYDMSAKYPEFEDRITALGTNTVNKTKLFDSFGYNDSDDVPVYEFYHKRTESMPDGRYMLMLADDIVLIDSPLPYRRIPVYRVAPSNILGTPFGYTPMFDILPIQDAVDSLYSTILTNQTAFGVQNVVVPKGADVNINSLAGGLNIIEMNMQMGRPEPLNLTATPAEVFNFLGSLERVMETISGVNSVARGNPEPSLRSGSALALVQSMTLQFMSGLQQEYVKLMEDLGTGLIDLLKDFASVPRVAMIGGKNNKPYMKEFVGEDLSGINRVVVDVGNPLMKTTAGRVQMADNLLQYGVIKDPRQYFEVISSGNLDTATEDLQRQDLLIRAENEMLVSGEKPMAIAVDDHAAHIMDHRGVLSDPDLRKDALLVQNTLTHIQEHIELLKSTDPNLLMLIGQQSLQAPPVPEGQAMNPGELPPGTEGNPALTGMTGQTVVPGQTGGQPAPEMMGPGLPSNQNLPKIPQAPDLSEGSGNVPQ